MTKTDGLRGLYAVTPDWPDTARLLRVTEAILAAGCGLVQYRNKTAGAELRRAQASALRRLTRRYHARLLINDDLALAETCEADGVHLGGADGDLGAARRRLDRLGAGRLLGASCYQSADRAHQAEAAGADYVAFGSVYPSPSKPHAARAGLALFATRLAVPRCAIGGITPDNAAPLVQAGAQLLAVIAALYQAPDPAAAARRFIALCHPCPRHPNPVHEEHAA